MDKKDVIGIIIVTAIVATIAYNIHGCINHPQFYYEEKVWITDGFYKGHSGTVVRDAYRIGCYSVKLEDGNIIEFHHSQIKRMFPETHIPVEEELE